MADSKQPLNAVIVHDGDGEQEAVPIGHDIFLSRDISNLYRVVTADGDVLINTGVGIHAQENARRFAAVSTNSIAKIVFTQGHPDHTGGWSTFVGPETETIAQANVAHVLSYWTALDTAMGRRVGQLWGGDLPVFAEPSGGQPKPEITTVFHDSHAFEIGGRRFELYATPGGETLDALIVWMPQERVVFTGNLTGPIFGHVPNLYTVRGDKIRYVQWFIDGVQRVIDLAPETLVTGHGMPISGADTIRQRLAQIRDAAIYLRDKTFEGMNAGVDLWTLMETIKLPPELDIPQGHGKVSWIVRAIWEEHLGWFRFESTTELYNVPPTAVMPDLVELAGGSAPVIARADHHLASGHPLNALHLADAVLATTPGDQAALSTKLRAHEQLLASNDRENFSEVRWLEAQVRALRVKLKKTGN